MRISVIAVGRLRPPYQDDVEHYRKLLAGHARVEVVEVREDEKVPPRVPERAFTVLLASDGVELDSVAFSDWLEERRHDGRDLCFVIGGPKGPRARGRHAALARADDPARTSSPAWCCSSSSTGPTRSSPGSRITISCR